MSKSIFATVQSNIEREIQASENKIKAEFLEFLNKELEILLKAGEQFRFKRFFKLPKGESHFEWEKAAELMGFEAKYEFDGYYGDTVYLNPKEGEARKLADQHNRKVEKQRIEEAKREAEIRKETFKAANKVVKELLGKLRTGDYILVSYDESSSILRVTYEKVSFMELNIDYFKSVVCDVLLNYQFKEVKFGGTSNNYYELVVKRPEKTKGE